MLARSLRAANRLHSRSCHFQTRKVRYKPGKSDESLTYANCLIAEDEDFAFLAKPFGMALHGEDGCFEDMVRATMPSASSYPPFHLYSLERICTGVAVFSKNRAAYDHFNRLDNDGRVDHGFLIGTNGWPNPKQAKVKAGIMRNAKDHRKFVLLDRRGSTIELNYKTLCLFKGEDSPKDFRSTIAVRNITKSGPQVRTVFSSMKVPIVGDLLYQKEKNIDLMPRERVGEYALYHSYYIRFPKFLQSGDYEIVAPFPQCWPEEHRQFQQEDFLKLFGPDEGFPLNLFGRLRSQDREQKQKAKEKEANLKDQTDDEVDPLTEEQKLSDAE